MNIFRRLWNRSKEEEVPEVTPPEPKLYGGAENEHESLRKLKEARNRDWNRLRGARHDLEVLEGMEARLLKNGERAEENEKLKIARKVKNIRLKLEEVKLRIDSIYLRRISVLTEHINSMEAVVELGAEELPSKEIMESLAIKAKTLLEDLEKSKELAEGVKIENDVEKSKKEEIAEVFGEPEEAEPDEEDEPLPMPEPVKKEVARRIREEPEPMLE